LHTSSRLGPKQGPGFSSHCRSVPVAQPGASVRHCQPSHVDKVPVARALPRIPANSCRCQALPATNGRSPLPSHHHRLLPQSEQTAHVLPGKLPCCAVPALVRCSGCSRPGGRQQTTHIVGRRARIGLPTTKQEQQGWVPRSGHTASAGRHALAAAAPPHGKTATGLLLANAQALHNLAVAGAVVHRRCCTDCSYQSKVTCENCTVNRVG
jgi:hypothetical protein